MTPDTHRIVYTHFDGTVGAIMPAHHAIARLTSGGGFYDPWIKQQPRGLLDEMVRRKTCADIQKGRPCPTSDAAWRLVNGLQYGGLSTPEAWDAIKDHDAARYGRLFDVQRLDEFPDAWWRSAWHRSANGGPIVVDLFKARTSQWERARAAVRAENAKRRDSFDGKRRLKINWEALRTAMRNARDEHELRKVWPL